MELNVSQLLMEPSGSSREYELDDPLLLDGGYGSVAIRGAVSLLRTNKSVWVSARLRSALDSECGRCLIRYSHPIRFELEEEYFPILNPMTGGRAELPDDDSDYYLIDERHTLDLSEPVRECVMMSEPMKPLCREDCAGLCPRCGADLNRTRCGCEPVRDARWGPLLEMMNGGDSD